VCVSCYRDELCCTMSCIFQSTKSLRTLNISFPSPILSPRGFRSIVITHCTYLRALSVQVDCSWIYAHSTRGRDMLDEALLHCSRLRSLTVTGPIATSRLLRNLPKSIRVLCWRKCPGIQPGPFAEFLCMTIDGAKTVPDLSYVAVSDDDANWSRADRKAVAGACQSRSIKFHGTPNLADIPILPMDDASVDALRHMFHRFTDEAPHPVGRETESVEPDDARAG
jgi:hypothetical protein